MDAHELEGRFGPYKLLRRIARGGMGEVFLATQILSGGYERTLVVKRILPHLSDDEQFVEMFLREAHTAASLRHKNIVRIDRVGQEGSRYYLAMDYVEGKDLGAFLRRAAERGETIPAEVSCYVVSEVCQGLGYAHRKKAPDGTPLQLVHRDVSPQNVLLSYDGGVHLIDFGLARAADACGSDGSGRLEGKVSYLSPEQALGDPVGQRSDIFSTGLVLFELLCGRRLITGVGDEQILASSRRFSARRALEPWRGRLPAPLVPVLERSLQERVEERYETAEEMGRDLDRFLADRGAVAGAAVLAESMTRFFQEEMARERDCLTRTRTVCPAPLRRGPVAGGGPEIGVPPAREATDPPSPVRRVPPHAHGDRRILKHKLVILVLLLIILFEAAVFILREIHWKREGLSRYRNVTRTVQPDAHAGR